MEFKERFSYRGWSNCVAIENGVFSLIATTDVGPRIISFGFKGDINLFLELDGDMGKTGGDKWRLYGGTRLWHAPEEIPRTYYPDNSRIKYEWGENILTLTQETEKKTGLQKEISIAAYSDKDNMIEIKYRIYNRNLWPIRFAPWALSVMRRNGTVIIPQEPYQTHSENLLPVRPVVLWAYTDMTDKRWCWGKRYILLNQDPDAETPQKIGLLNRQGWAAYHIGDNLFIKKSRFIADAEYPDYQSNLETYTDRDIIEIETLGPLETAGPGGFAEHEEKWYLFKTEMDHSEDSIYNNIEPLIEQNLI